MGFSVELKLLTPFLVLPILGELSMSRDSAICLVSIYFS